MMQNIQKNLSAFVNLQTRILIFDFSIKNRQKKEQEKNLVLNKI